MSKNAHNTIPQNGGQTNYNLKVRRFSVMWRPAGAQNVYILVVVRSTSLARAAVDIGFRTRIVCFCRIFFYPGDKKEAILGCFRLNTLV